jgi:AraC-like DNA-binding protein
MRELYCDHGLSLSTIAAQLRISRFHLSHILGRYTGRGFREHLSCFRLEAARELLVGSYLSVKEIAASVGYSSTSSFDRDFRRLHGCSPTEWQRRNCSEFELHPAAHQCAQHAWLPDDGCTIDATARAAVLTRDEH